ncbi:MAG: M23 family metallopeptidase [Sinobacterium sp.]|nr:M23 family metallopeptidase [Sinobacterium sp.]
MMTVCSFFVQAFELELNGQFIQGGMIVGRADGASAVSIDGVPLAVSSEGYFVFGFGRDFASKAQLSLTLNNGEKLIEPIDVAPREYNVQRVEGISKKIMAKEKPPETLKRIRAETNAVKAARAQHVESLAFSSSFVWPVVAPISGVYGSQRVYNGQPGRPHYGVDMAAPIGTAVVAPADAVVTLAYDNMYYSGGTLIMDHGYGVSSSFLHLSEILVKVGEQVKQGQVVAKIGAGGRSTGPHLDWRMNWYKQRIDPALLVPPMPAKR